MFLIPNREELHLLLRPSSSQKQKSLIQYLPFRQCATATGAAYLSIYLSGDGVVVKLLRKKVKETSSKIKGFTALFRLGL